jgi:3-dehydroquinate synthase
MSERSVSIHIEIEGESPYAVHLGRGILGDLPGLLEKEVLGETRRGKQIPLMVITDRRVARHYLATVRSSLRRSGYRTRSVVLPAGERTKSFRHLERVLRGMARAGMTRDSAVIALGGGVIGDLAGFAASVYMRGCDCVQVPTTLLSQVDSSVGGKTGINLPEGKNLAGSFSSPVLVLADRDTMHTLPDREICAGFAEIIKCGLISREPLFRNIQDFLERLPHQGEGWSQLNLADALLSDDHFLQEIIRASLEVKAEIVAADMREKNLRMTLNFGHTFGHAVERITGYRRFLHGEAVLLGMEMAVELSRFSDMLTDTEATRVSRILGKLPLPSLRGIRPNGVYRAMTADKKKLAGEINYILLEKIGSALPRAGIPRREIVESIRVVLNRRSSGGPIT